MLRIVSLAVVCFSTLLPGCDANPKTYPLSGVVTLDGQKIAGATIVFVPVAPATEVASATSKDDGSFTATTFVSGDGCFPGQYKVKVYKYEGLPIPPAMAEPPKDYDPDNRVISPPPKNLLPVKYFDESKSGLSVTVNPQPTKFDIALTKK